MNLPTPTLPTDNLYKFLAIAGLVLLMAAIVVPLQLQNQIDREAARLTATIRARGDVSDRKWDEAVAVAKARLLSTHPTTTLTATTQPTGNSPPDDGQNLIDGYRVEYRIAVRTVAVALCAGGVGLAMMIAGFAFWYRRVQRYQDEIIRAEAIKMRTERS